MNKAGFRTMDFLQTVGPAVRSRVALLILIQELEPNFNCSQRLNGEIHDFSNISGVNAVSILISG